MQPEHGALPVSDHDYFVWQEPVPAASVREAVTKELERVGVLPFERLGAFTSQDAVTLARRATFFEIYRLEVDEIGWLHFRRLRDDRLLATRPLDKLDVSALGRAVVVAAWNDGKSGIVRYTRRTPAEAATSLKRVALCKEGEGQCFHYSNETDEAPRSASEPSSQSSR
jgi:hypothetical protein